MCFSVNESSGRVRYVSVLTCARNPLGMVDEDGLSMLLIPRRPTAATASRVPEALFAMTIARGALDSTLLAILDTEVMFGGRS